MTAQEKKDSARINILQFKESETKNIIDYKVTVIPKGNDSNAHIVDRTSNKINLANGKYLVFIETLPLTKFSIKVENGTVYELLIAYPGTVNFTSSEEGTIDIYYIRDNNSKDKILSNISLGEGEQKEIELQEGLYQIVRKNKILNFKVKSNEKVSIEL